MTSMASALAVWAEAGLPLAAVNPVTPLGPWNSLVTQFKGRDISIFPN